MQPPPEGDSSRRRRNECGGIYFNKSGDYRDSNWYQIHLRAHEFAERQLVSLLDIKGIGKNNRRALWKVGVTTAEALIHADAEELVAKLRPYINLPVRHESALEAVRSWQSDASRQWKEKEQSRQAPPEAECDDDGA